MKAAKPKKEAAGGNQKQKLRAGKHKEGVVPEKLTVCEFVDRTRHLLEMERAEEVDEVSAAINGLSEKVKRLCMHLETRGF